MTTAAPPAPPSLPTPNWLGQMSDRCNPILVREVQQVLRGKMFLIALGLQLLAIVIAALIIANGMAGGVTGRVAFVAALGLITPIALMLIPLQAFVAMQSELRGGIGEQLLLSRLTPARIVRGKQMAALVQIGLFMSVLGPMLAFTYLLTGVDVATILFFTVLTIVACLCTSTFAIATGTLARLPILRPLLYAGTAAALGGLMISTWAVLDEMVREVAQAIRNPDFWRFIAIASTVAGLCVVLLSLIARSVLTHPNENRSTAFRAFALLAIVIAFVCIVLSVPLPWLGDAAPVLATSGSVGLAVFWLFALTEEQTLSPRARTLVPCSRFLALLSVPFLPGAGRGVGFVIVSCAVLFGASGLLAWLGPSRSPADSVWWAAAAASALYGFGYAGLAGIIRRGAVRGTAGNWVGRLTLPFLVVIGCLVPLLIDLLAENSVGRWSMVHITNPFLTIAHIIDRKGDRWTIVVVVACAAGAVLLAMLPAMQRGLREVLAASAERRHAP